MSESKTIELDVGTIHPVLIEPFRIRLWVQDEIVTDCEITYNAAHRGIERLLEGIPVKKANMITEKVCGLCSHAHLWNSIRACEKAMDLDVPERANYIRVLTMELDRIHSHLFFLAHGFETLGHETFTYRTFALREPVMRILQEMTGNRVHYSVPILGGIRPRTDLTESVKKKITPSFNELEKSLMAFVERVTTDPMVMSRITGVGILTPEIAEKYYAVGPTARGSGINNDQRASMREYKDFDFEYIVLKDCDVKDRLLVRAFELFESINICKQIMDEIPAGSIYETPKMRFDTDIASVYNEAPRGELYHSTRIDARGNTRNYRIRTPTPTNLACMEKACIGDQVTDAMLTIVSCDPCLSCSNRALVIDEDTKKQRWMDLGGVRKKC